MCSGCRALRQVFKGLLLLVAVDVLLSCLSQPPALSVCFALYHAPLIIVDQCRSRFIHVISEHALYNL